MKILASLVAFLAVDAKPSFGEAQTPAGENWPFDVDSYRIHQADRYSYYKVLRGPLTYDSFHFAISDDSMHDLHIGFSEEDSHDASRIEIVLGGWYKTRSVIRSGNQEPAYGHVSVLHTEEEFDDFKKSFYVEVDKVKQKVGIYKGNGEAFLEWTSPVVTQRSMPYLHVSLGFGGRGLWRFDALRKPQKHEGECEKCDGCPNGINTVQPYDTDLVCANGKMYLAVDPEKNFAHYDARRLNGKTSGWLCDPEHRDIEYSYDQAGTTNFKYIGVIHGENDSVELDVEDFTFARSYDVKLTNGTVLNRDVKLGSAGDCLAWANCDDTKKGEFSIDLAGTGFSLNNVGWKYSGWPDYLTMADYEVTDTSASARCGGWCGGCEPDTENGNIPIRFTGAVKPTKAPKPVDMRLDKLGTKVGEILGQAFEGKRALQDKLNEKVAELIELRFHLYDNFVQKSCEFPSTWKVEEQDVERYDRDDPCRGMDQLFKGFEKWGAIFNANCNSENRKFNNHNRRTAREQKLKNRIKQKMQCPE